MPPLTIRLPGFFVTDMPVLSPSSPRAARSKPGTPQAPAPLRRTQRERSSDTQLRLCQAAVELLTEVGYERLTTAQIAQRAGVSKGAQAHHYPSKDDMLAAAFEHLLAQWEQRREAYANRLDRAGDRAGMDDVLLNMWRQVFGRPDYLASLELMLAARHNAVLRDRLRALLRTWTVARDETFRRLVPLDDPEELATFMQINFCVLRGLAVYEGLADDRALSRHVLDMWTRIANAYLIHRQRPAPLEARAPSRKPTKRSSKP